MAQFSAYERPPNHKNDRTIAVRNIIRDADTQRRRGIGGYNGVNPALGCFGSTFWRRWFLLGSPLPLLWWGPRHNLDDRDYSPSVEGLTQLVACYDRPPQLAPLSVGGLSHFKASVRCRLMMLWTAPPPARECDECGRC